MIKQVSFFTLILSFSAFSILYFTGHTDTAFSVVISSFVSLINFIFLSCGISKLLDAKPVAIFFNSFRLIFFIITMSSLIYFKIANVLGLFIGFTIAVATIAAVGIIDSRKTDY